MVLFFVSLFIGLFCLCLIYFFTRKNPTISYQMTSDEKQIWTNGKAQFQNYRMADELQRYRHAVEGAKAIMWELTTNCRSPLTILFDGTKHDETGRIRKKLSSRIHPDDVQMLENHLHQCFGGICKQFECEHRFKDRHGEYRWLITRGQVNHESEKHRKKIVGISFDITEKRTEVVKLHEMASKR